MFKIHSTPKTGVSTLLHSLFNYICKSTDNIHTVLISKDQHNLHFVHFFTAFVTGCLTCWIVQVKFFSQTLGVQGPSGPVHTQQLRKRNFPVIFYVSRCEQHNLRHDHDLSRVVTTYVLLNRDNHAAHKSNRRYNYFENYSVTAVGTTIPNQMYKQNQTACANIAHK